MGPQVLHAQPRGQAEGQEAEARGITLEHGSTDGTRCNTVSSCAAPHNAPMMKWPKLHGTMMFPANNICPFHLPLTWWPPAWAAAQTGC